MNVSRFNSAADSTPKPGDVVWPEGFDDFREVDGTPRQGIKDPGKDGPGWSPTTYGTPYRKDDHVLLIHALVLDYDSGALDAEDTLSRWDGYERVLHSTYKPGRWRVIIPYETPLSPHDHARVYQWAIKREGTLIDATCKNPSRFFYWPCARTDLDIEPTFAYIPGRKLSLPADAPHIQSPPSPLNVTMRGLSPASGEARGAADDVYSAVTATEQREDAALIEQRCRFMARVKAEATTIGEPEWYAGLSILARCKGGDDLAHEWSKPYAGYNHAETEAKYQRTKLVGPATCAHVRTISPACATCPLHITSPVQLGRNDERPAVEEPAADLDPHAVIKDAEAALAEARVAEDTALVRKETARRALSALRRANAIASEDDVAAAVREASAADESVRAAERTRKAREKALVIARKAVSTEGLPPGADPAVWQRLHLSKEGRPVDTVANVLRVMGDDPRWSSRLSFDTFSLDVLLDGKVLPEESATELTAKLGYDYALDTRTSTTMECVRTVAHRREVHPVRAWLDTLSWDGTPRVGSLLARGFGAVVGDSEELVERMSVCFLLSMVARVYQPGAKVDTMLVLIGKQGARKSTGLETLASYPWYSGSKLDLLSKDSFINLRGKWLYEIAELEGLKRVEASASKAWMSNRIDTYRAPYERRSADHPRQTVMAGTTNEETILLDPSGSRRYHPVPVHEVDTDWLAEYRGQLFAEAAVMYRAGTSWWIPEGTDMAEKLAAWSLPFQSQHPWTETIYSWLIAKNTPAVFSTVDVITRALMKDAKDITHNDQTAAGNVLRALGCTRAGRSRGNLGNYYRVPEGIEKNAANVDLVEKSLRVVAK